MKTVSLKSFLLLCFFPVQNKHDCGLKKLVLSLCTPDPRLSKVFALNLTCWVSTADMPVIVHSRSGKCKRPDSFVGVGTLSPGREQRCSYDTQSPSSHQSPPSPPPVTQGVPLPCVLSFPTVVSWLVGGHVLSLCCLALHRELVQQTSIVLPSVVKC